MRDSKRIERILNKIRIIWENNPDLRLWQLMYFIVDGVMIDLFFLEDDVLEEYIDSKI